ncbi:hypothetical protein Plec18170_001266 [Paecilomyces lecythidis]
MPYRRNYTHVVEVPFWDYMIRFLQVILASALLILTAYTITLVNSASVRLSLFSSAWDISILVYYLIAVHGLPFIYNWVAVIIVEFLTITFWAASFSALAKLYTDRRSARLLDDHVVIAVIDNVIIAIIALSAFVFVLHVVTFIMIVHGVRKHRKKGKPLFSRQATRSTIDSTPQTQQV